MVQEEQEKVRRKDFFKFIVLSKWRNNLKYTFTHRLRKKGKSKKEIEAIDEEINNKKREIMPSGGVVDVYCVEFKKRSHMKLISVIFFIYMYTMITVSEFILVIFKIFQGALSHFCLLVGIALEVYQALLARIYPGVKSVSANCGVRVEEGLARIPAYELVFNCP